MGTNSHTNNYKLNKSTIKMKFDINITIIYIYSIDLVITDTKMSDKKNQRYGPNKVINKN
jgi:hypothetical protein